MTVALGPQPLDEVRSDLVRWGLPRPAGRYRSTGAPWSTRVGSRLLVDGLAATAGGLVLGLAAPAGTLAGGWTVAAGALLLAWLGLVAASGSYGDRLVESEGADVRRVLACGIRLAVLAAALAWLLLPTVPRAAAVAAVAATVGSSTLYRAGSAWSAGRQRRRGNDTGRTVLVVGHDDAAASMSQELGRRASGRVDVAGTCPPDPELVPVRAELLGVDGVIVLPCPHLGPVDTRRLAWRLADDDRHLLLSPGLSGVDQRRTSVTTLAELPLVHVRHTELTSLRRNLTHLAGRVVAAFALLALAPLLAVLALAIRRDSPGPVLFRQTRVGHHEAPFTMLKFRTMRCDAAARRDELADDNESDGVLFKIRHDPRVTRLGRFLRRYSLDELPQLVNVVRGEMALVGPRPPLPEEVAEYADDVRRRFAAAPGMTGLWQVSGRSDLDWEESVRLDLSYVDNWSPSLDARILVRTVAAVCGHRGAY